MRPHEGRDGEVRGMESGRGRRRRGGREGRGGDEGGGAGSGERTRRGMGGRGRERERGREEASGGGELIVSCGWGREVRLAGFLVLTCSRKFSSSSAAAVAAASLATAVSEGGEALGEFVLRWG